MFYRAVVFAFMCIAVAQPEAQSQTTAAPVEFVSSFAGSLSRNMDRPVIDMTGLTGTYNIRLAFKPANAPPEDSGPSIFTALGEQLGLRLESRKGPVEVIVIDSIEKVREP